MFCAKFNLFSVRDKGKNLGGLTQLGDLEQTSNIVYSDFNTLTFPHTYKLCSIRFITFIQQTLILLYMQEMNVIAKNCMIFLNLHRY